jgi:hypothetical protein
MGELQVTYPDALHTIGYVPSKIPHDVTLDTRYAEHRRTNGDDFSLLEPLQYWADLSASGVTTDQIHMIVIGGGTITACECQIALALGVATAVIDEAGTAVGRCLTELDWLTHARLQRNATTAPALQRFIQGEVTA